LTWAIVWLLVVGLWLYFAYQLEYEGRNTYREILLAAGLLFFVNIGILVSLLVPGDQRKIEV
jgi:hypothetical protein